MNKEDIEYCNQKFKTALQLKEIARTSDDNFQVYEEAAENYGMAADYILNKILKSKINFDEEVQVKALAHYYLYEKYDCLYGFNYKQNIFQTAIQFAKDAESEISKALQIINENFNKLDSKTQGFLSEMKKNWNSCIYSIKVKKIEPTAKEAMLNKDYILAFDCFNKMLNLQKSEYEYNEDNDLEYVYMRTSKANYFAMSANISQSMAGLIIQKTEEKKFIFNSTTDLIGHFVNSIEIILEAYKTNPEIEKYRNGAEAVKKSIGAILSDNKEKWHDYLIEFSNNELLKKIMKKTDNELYKREAAKLEIDSNPTKKFILIGLFWIVVLMAVSYVLIMLATANISWYRFLAVLFGLPLLITILGAFILRTTDSLKEENFLKLMNLALKINLQGLKSLASKKE